MSSFHYVYILVDEATGTHFYIGCTEESRLEKHNKGDVPHTSKYKPWRIKNAIAFENKEKACAFEAYLKTHCAEHSSNGIFNQKSSDNLIQPEISISPSPYRKLSKNYNPQL